jgi:hypothetical protein
VAVSRPGVDDLATGDEQSHGQGPYCLLRTVLERVSEPRVAPSETSKGPLVYFDQVQLRILLGIVVVGLVAVSAASAKAVPRFSTTVAAPGEPVTVDFGRGATYYLAPLEVYLVRIAVEPEITGRRDPRLHLVGKLGSVNKPITATKLRFRVPRLAPCAC